MNWDVDFLICNDDFMIFPFDFSSQLLAIDISVTERRSTWYRSGYLRPLVNLDGNLALGLSHDMTFGLQLIEIPFRNYKLRFNPNNWLENSRIKVKQLDPSVYHNIIMQVIPASSNSPQVGEDSFESFVPTDGTDPSPVFQIVPAFRRRAIRITNKTTAGMYLKSGVAGGSQPLVAADPFTFVPSGASYSSEDYSGEINGVMDGVFLDGGLIIVSQSPYII